jgi:uncharacterized membrane-anchored protein
MNPIPATRSNKVPEVVLAFWIIKIIATTLGETGGDAVSMSMGLGYAIGSVIFIALFVWSPLWPRFARTPSIPFSIGQ